MTGLLIALLSPFLLILSFPNFDFGFLAWVALVPLLIGISGKNAKRAFSVSLVCGMLFNMGVFHWILQFPNYTYIHHALLAVYLGSFLGFFGLLFSFVSRVWGSTASLFAAPFIWVALEYLRSNLSFLSLPWGLLAHSQHQYHPIIQIASVTGTYSISFLIVLANAAIASFFLKPGDSTQVAGSRLSIARSGLGEGKPRHINRGNICLGGLTALLAACTLAYGYVSLKKPFEGKRLKVAVIQGNIEQRKKWDPRHAREIRRIYRELTKQASVEQPGLIIWPETATPGSITQNPVLHKEVKDLAKDVETHLLLGSAQHRKLGKEESRKEPKYYNSAFLIPPGEAVGRFQRYNKIRLFPFGEYIPFRKALPWSLIGIDITKSDNYTPGVEYKVFKHPDFRFGTIICWENLFPDLFRQFVKRGAQVMINLTNEAHFGKSPISRQLLGISVFRAVENRLYLIRCANTGISCIIDPHGRVIDRIRDEKGQDTFVRGFMNGWVICSESVTFYTRHGDIWVWVCVSASVTLLAATLWKRRKMRCA